MRGEAVGAARFITPGETVGAPGSSDPHVVVSVHLTGTGRSGYLYTIRGAGGGDDFGAWEIDTSGNVMNLYLGSELTAKSVFRTSIASVLSI